ncbi:penicillin acylase family protein [Reinekea thalattae]|uniref:Penicillin acylase family protein n=1 Tax=Reinekea thalattae TaxID=2593301 RepID=A0A5C8Z933_9GAMM|nr:penicillin acylase family protein [Reinekea thalattae]TXR53661.1 penicillin acylase family protein [Reinekea thalattae]
MSVLDDQNVEIHWSEYDVPHIKAKNYYALGVGYGYAHAQDRLAELCGQAIALRGERCKYYGAEGISTVGFLQTTNLNSDLMYRIRLPDEWGNNSFSALTQQAQDYVQGYVSGLNHYVASLTEQQKTERLAGEPLVTFSIADVIRFTMRFGIMKELVEMGPHLLASTLSVCADELKHSPHTKEVIQEGGFGSNAWAFGGDVAKGFGSILLGNPHSAWQRTPHQQRIYMHQYHLTIEGELDVAGSSFLGFPLPMTGYNSDVSWSILDAATVTPFVLQKMKLESDDTGYYYRVDGEKRALAIRTIDIPVLQNNGSVAQQQYSFLESEIGIVYKLPERPGKPEGWYAITNPNENNAAGLDQFLAAAKSASTEEFTHAIEQNRGILCQLVVADRHGYVGYVIAGRAPALTDDQMVSRHVRLPDAAFNVLDGSKSESFLRDANGNIQLADASFYPTIHSRGIIHNTNNSYKFTEYGKEQPDYASVFGQHKADYQLAKPIAAGLRYDPRLIMSYRRMSELVAAQAVKPEHVLQVIFDNRNYAAETFLDDILLKLSNVDLSESVSRGFQILAQWDQKNNAESTGALLFNQFWSQLIAQGLLVAPASGDPSKGSQLLLNQRNAGELVDAMQSAIDTLEQCNLALNASWGSVLHQQADGGLIPMHGGSYQEGLLNGEMPGELTDKGFAVILFGTVYIQRVHWQQEKLVADVLLSHGQRETIDSNSRSRQLAMFANKQLYRAPFLSDGFDNSGERLLLNLTAITSVETAQQGEML